MAGWKVDVTGLRQLFDALNEMDKAAARNITKDITKAAKSVATAASYISPGTNPLSGWGNWTDSRTGRDLSFDPASISAAFKVQRNNYRRRGVSAGISWDVYNASPAGSIFELANDGARGNTAWHSNPQFVASLRERFPRKQPRSLIPAYYEVMTEDLRDSIRDSILDAARKAGLV